MITNFIHLLIFLPLFGFLVSLFFKTEKQQTVWIQGWLGISLLSLIGLGIAWALQSFPQVELKELTVLKTEHYHFFIALYFDRISFVFSLAGLLISFLVARYSSVYMHREQGFHRFFSTIGLFIFGFQWTIFSGNLETLFIGWEILGIASFLLIAFYRDRNLPVKNAGRVYSTYRIGDVGLLLAMWLMHHFWEANISFSSFLHTSDLSHHFEQHSLLGSAIALLLLLAAFAKSAQFPFSSWLPRAMEGPTPSSAIFYGSLSVHLGLFLVLRTYPFFENQLAVRWFMGIMGLATALVASQISHVQPTVKSQIGYDSITQIGIMFIEIALGLESLVLIHFVGNAFLRTYQLLVSPSIATFSIREQMFGLKKRNLSPRFSKIKTTLFLLSVKEWNLEKVNYHLFWKPLKTVGRKLKFIPLWAWCTLFLVAFGWGVVAEIQFSESKEPSNFLPTLLFSILGILMVMRSFSESKKPILAWILVLFNHILLALAIGFNEHFSLTHQIWYLSGIVPAGIFGIFLLNYLRKKVGSITLKDYQGWSNPFPKLAFLFLFTGLVMTGFPISPTFIGEDLIFSHIHPNQWWLASIVSVGFILDGLAILRIYSRVFLGVYSKGQQAKPYQNS